MQETGDEAAAHDPEAESSTRASRRAARRGTPSPSVSSNAAAGYSAESLRQIAMAEGKSRYPACDVDGAPVSSPMSSPGTTDSMLRSPSQAGMQALERAQKSRSQRSASRGEPACSPGVGINTYFIVTRGAELIVAWRREDLHECDALREILALDALHAIPSLTIVRAVKGDVIFMPADTVHMVIR